MKKYVLISMMMIAGLMSEAQDSWTIRLNTKTVITGKSEDEAKNVKKIHRSNFKKSGALQVFYKETAPQAGWVRSILIVDENDNEIARIDSLTAKSKIDNSVFLSKVFGIHKLRIFTISLPTDPKIREVIRVRRVHLGTLEFEPQ